MKAQLSLLASVAILGLAVSSAAQAHDFCSTESLKSTYIFSSIGEMKGKNYARAGIVSFAFFNAACASARVACTSKKTTRTTSLKAQTSRTARSPSVLTRKIPIRFPAPIRWMATAPASLCTATAKRTLFSSPRMVRSLPGFPWTMPATMKKMPALPSAYRMI